MTAPCPESPGFADHFSDRADAYAARRPTYPPELADWLAGLAPRRRRAWDCGCGSGQLAVLLADRFDRVVGIDGSREQLRSARRHPRVWYRRALAGATGLPAASMDLATAAQAAHWFDLEGYYAEVRRVGRPGSAVALVTYGRMRIDAAVDAVMEAFRTGVLAPHWPAGRALVEDRYRSLPFPFPEVEPPRFVMRERWTLEELLGYVGTWSGVKRLRRAEGPAPVEALRRDLGRAWGRPGTVRTVRWPLDLRVGHLPGGARP